MNEQRSHTMSTTDMFSVRSDCGDRDSDLPGCRYFAIRSNESHVSGWVSEDEYRWLCNRFGVTPPEGHERPAIEAVAYDTKNKPLRGFSVRASYLKNSQEALIEVSRDGKVVRSFNYPAYRIWNIPAHLNEYIEPEALTDEERR